MYLQEARENSIKARLQCGKKARSKTRELSTNSCSKILKLCILVLIAVVVCTKLKIVNDLHEDTTNQPKLNEPTLRTSTPLELGMGPEYSSDIASDGPRKRTFDDDDYDPELQRVKKKII